MTPAFHRQTALLAILTGAAIVLSGCGNSEPGPGSGGPQVLLKPELGIELSADLAAMVDKLYAVTPADRAHSACRLGQLGEAARPATPYLIDRLTDPNWQVRRQAAEALGAVADGQAVAPLIEVLEDRDGDWAVRAAAARSLGRLGDPRAVEALIAVRNDMSAHVRHMAVVALGQIGTPETLEPLAAAARSDSDAAARFSAAQAIRRLENSAAAGDSR